MYNGSFQGIVKNVTKWNGFKFQTWDPTIKKMLHSTILCDAAEEPLISATKLDQNKILFKCLFNLLILR